MEGKGSVVGCQVSLLKEPWPLARKRCLDFSGVFFPISIEGVRVGQTWDCPVLEAESLNFSHLLSARIRVIYFCILTGTTLSLERLTCSDFVFYSIHTAFLTPEIDYCLLKDKLYDYA